MKKAGDPTHAEAGAWVSGYHQLDNERHKPIIRKFKKCKVYSACQFIICGAYLAEMQLISK